MQKTEETAVLESLRGLRIFLANASTETRLNTLLLQYEQKGKELAMLKFCF